MTAREAIRESKELMRGNKWRLFCLEFSFIGWELLTAALVGIIVMLVMTPMIFAGSFVESRGVFTLIVLLLVLMIIAIVMGLTLSPYITASIAVFYREISEGRYSNPHVEGEAGEYTYGKPDEFYHTEPPVQEIIEE